MPGLKFSITTSDHATIRFRQVRSLWRLLKIESDIELIVVTKREQAGAIEAVDVVFVRRVVGAEAVGAHFRFDMDYRRAMISQMLADSGSRGKGRKFDDLDIFQCKHGGQKSVVSSQ